MPSLLFAHVLPFPYSLQFLEFELEDAKTMKLEIKELRKGNEVLTDDRDSLISEVQGLQSSNELKDERCKNLKNQLESHFSEIQRATNCHVAHVGLEPTSSDPNSITLITS